MQKRVSRIAWLGVGVFFGFGLFWATHHYAHAIQTHLSHSSSPEYPFLLRHEHFLSQAAAHPPLVAFFGDSITDHWRDFPEEWSEMVNPIPAANCGVGMENLAGLTWRVEHGEADAPSLKMAVVLIGTNDLTGGESPETVAAHMAHLLKLIMDRPAHPRVLLLGILPRGASPDDPMREKVKQTNRLLASLANANQVRYLDLGLRLVTADGTIPPEILSDGLHPAREGYRILREGIKPVLREMIGQ